MTEDKQKKEESESLIASAKGIWPLIVSVIVIAIYLMVSVVMYFISYKWGRL